MGHHKHGCNEFYYFRSRLFQINFVPKRNGVVRKVKNLDNSNNPKQSVQPLQASQFKQIVRSATRLVYSIDNLLVQD